MVLSFISFVLVFCCVCFSMDVFVCLSVCLCVGLSLILITSHPLTTVNPVCPSLRLSSSIFFPPHFSPPKLAILLLIGLPGNKVNFQRLKLFCLPAHELGALFVL